MVGELSEDGKWMWDGTGWVEKPTDAEVLPPWAVNQQQVAEVANQTGVNEEQLGKVAPYFDQNKDGVLQRSELEQAAKSVANPAPKTTNGGPTSSPPSKTLEIKNNEGSKPWHIKVISILIIIMASLGGVIGQQVSKIDEKATKMESHAAKNMSAARALETLENQVVFRDEALLVEATTLILQAEEISGQIDNQRIISEDSWYQLIGEDISLAILSLYFWGEIDSQTLISALCEDDLEIACSKYYINEMTNTVDQDPCIGLFDNLEPKTCATRLVFNQEELSKYNFTINNEIFSAGIMWEILSNIVGEGSDIFFASDGSTLGINTLNKNGNNELWKCDFLDSICIDIYIQPQLQEDLIAWCPDFQDPVLVQQCPEGLEYTGDDSFFDYLYDLEVEAYIIELQIASPDDFISPEESVEEYRILLAILNQKITTTENDYEIFIRDLDNYYNKHIDLADKWYFSASETATLITSRNANINLSISLIEDTTAWENGFVSNVTGDFISENSREDFLRFSYGESIATYEIADEQTQNATEMREKAGAVYSSVLYISIATALCGIVSGRVGSKKYTMTLPMTIVGLGSFGYGCFIFGTGIMI